MTYIELNEAENQAKQFIARLGRQASEKPCDTSRIGINITLPLWYNDIKFKRGQKYFRDNLFGMEIANLMGLLTLLADPLGLHILSCTGKASTPLKARKRYVSTLLNVKSWYELDLTPKSKSWKSLSRVRKMHLVASNMSTNKNVGIISQLQLSLTTFGFMGFALVRPQFFGIHHDNQDDRDAFIHFWAVIGHILGVFEQYNMCLFPTVTVEIICQIMLRYIFIPLIQFENQQFRKMVQAILSGLSIFIPFLTYDLQMFCVKRVIGVPGYQYKVDLTKEKLIKQIFANIELIEINNLLSNHSSDYNEYIHIFREYVPLMEKVTANLADNLKIKYIQTTPDAWVEHLNDSQFYLLSRKDQIILKFRCHIMNAYGSNSVIRLLCNWGLSAVHFMMQLYLNQTIKKQKQSLNCSREKFRIKM